MKKSGSVLKNSSSRRLFLRNGMIAVGAATMGPGLLPGSLAVSWVPPSSEYCSHKSVSTVSTACRNRRMAMCREPRLHRGTYDSGRRHASIHSRQHR